MALPIQYDLFEDNSEENLLKKEVDSLTIQMQNIRKGLFARHNKLEEGLAKLLQMYLSQEEELAKLRRLLIEVKNGVLAK